jgi:two-component system response regulator HydG
VAGPKASDEVPDRSSSAADAAAPPPVSPLDFRRDPAVLAPLVDVLGEAVFSTDREGRIVAWSHGMAERTGVPAADAQGRTLLEVDRDGLVGLGELRQLASRDAGAVAEFTLRCEPNGRRVHGRAVAVADARGRGAGLLAVLHGEPPDRRSPVVAPRPDRIEALADLVGASPAMQETFRRIRLAARSDVVTWISGESGTGKELAARAIHDLGARRDARFVAINCSALSESLLESELFGHVRGAFTGAVRDRVGVIQEANGGTLLLDEIGDIGHAMQVKLLRVLQERVVRPVGGDRDLPVDVRFLTATNKDLRELVRSGAMREDFFYRIGIYEIRMPPLRERTEDIPLLVEHFRQRLAEEQERPVESISAAAMRCLQEHAWPGNVRELRNAIEHAFVTVDDGRIELVDLPESVRLGTSPGPRVDVPGGGDLAATDAFGLSPREQHERHQILHALEQCGWHRARTAEQLGFSRVTLWKKMRRYRIDEGIFRRG